MDLLGYLVTNQFVLIGVDTNLVLQVLDEDQAPMATLHLTDVRKVRLLSPTTAVAVVGLPQKAGDVYNYLHALTHTQHTFEEVVADLESLFNGNEAEMAHQVYHVQAAIQDYTDAQGVVQEAQLLAHLAQEPALQQVAVETLQLRQRGNVAATQVFVLAHEQGRTRLARYELLGTNLSNHRPEGLPPDQLDFVLCSSVYDQTRIQHLQQGYQHLLQANLPPGWEHDPRQVDALKERARTYLQQALQEVNSFQQLPPNIVFYELSPATGNVFREPGQPLRTLVTRRT